MLGAFIGTPEGLLAQAGPRRVLGWVGDAPVPAASTPVVQMMRTSPGLVTAASLVLPGTGQLLLGQSRWALFAGFEIGAWIFHLERRREGHRLRNDYHDLSWRVARGGSPMAREDGDWEYYERMGSWIRSGGFDSDPARPGVQPETDLDSFNGATWVLAQDIYLTPGAREGDPSWAKAVAYYERRAYPAELAWDWRGKETSLVEYRNLIEASDEALRTATVVLGAVVANHLLSAVDAFISSHGGPSVTAGAGLHTSPLGRPAFRWALEVTP